MDILNSQDFSFNIKAGVFNLFKHVAQ